MNQPTNIALFPNETRDHQLTFTKIVIEYLTAFGAKLFISVTARPLLADTEIAYWEKDAFPENMDLAITIGGDGTLLNVAGFLSQRQIPILGINLGNLGYTTSIEKNELALLDKLWRGDYLIENRLMNDVFLNHNGKTTYLGCSLNEAVISRGHISKIVAIDLYCNDQFTHSFRGDGVLIGTPTGSTAYSMAAGGPIIDPAIRCLTVTPICSFSLESRSIMFGEDSVLRIVLNHMENREAHLSIDGNYYGPILQGDHITMMKSKHSAQIIQLKSTNFFETLRMKLMKGNEEA